MVTILQYLLVGLIWGIAIIILILKFIKYKNQKKILKGNKLDRENNNVKK